MFIAEHIRKEFDGTLVFGDIHGDILSLMRAYDFAIQHNYFFMSLGDLVDRGRHPYETVAHMHSVITRKQGGFVIGNHDDEFYKYKNKSDVTLSRDATNTLVDVGDHRCEEFLRMYSEIIEHPTLSGMFHVIGDIVLVHAASHPSMWDSNILFNKSAKYRALYGETNGERYDNGYPVRLYNWIEEIPAGKTVIVGHDRAPMFNAPMLEPMVQTNANGGTAFFIDTGCGKGGYLSGAVINHTDDGFKFDRFVSFK